MNDAAIDQSHGSPSHEHPEHDHPGTGTYWIVGLVLAVLTLLEVAVFYIDALEPALVPILLTLTTGKFALVVLFYMHLKSDHRIFAGVFVAPLLLAMFVVVALIVLFRVLPAYS
jgi:cytochrome c oxidase subunit 4